MRYKIAYSLFILRTRVSFPSRYEETLPAQTMKDDGSADLVLLRLKSMEENSCVARNSSSVRSIFSV